MVHHNSQRTWLRFIFTHNFLNFIFELEGSCGVNPIMCKSNISFRVEKYFIVDNNRFRFSLDILSGFVMQAQRFHSCRKFLAKPTQCKLIWICKIGNVFESFLSRVSSTSKGVKGFYFSESEAVRVIQRVDITGVVWNMCKRCGRGPKSGKGCGRCSSFLHRSGLILGIKIPNNKPSHELRMSGHHFFDS